MQKAINGVWAAILIHASLEVSIAKSPYVCVHMHGSLPSRSVDASAI